MSKKIEGVFKKGDVVWVHYRNDPLWPALVQNVYPKKITYVFFPLPEIQPGKKPTLFSCNPKNAFRLSVGERMPRNADQKLVEAIKAAKLYLVKEGKQDGSDAPPRPDTKPIGDDGKDEDSSGAVPAISKESNTETENDGMELDEEDACGSDEDEDDLEDEEDTDDDMPVLKKARSHPPFMRKGESSSLEETETGEDEFIQNGDDVRLDDFTQVIEDNYYSILENLFSEPVVRGYSVPGRQEMRLTMAGTKFLTDDNVDALFERIVKFVNEREAGCRILPAIHLVTQVLFPETVIRCLMIHKDISYEEAKLFVYSPENGKNSSVDTEKCSSPPPISGLDALVRVACEERAKVADSS